MLLAIDIGNSTIKFGIFDGESLIDKFNIATKLDYTADELAFDRFHVLDDQFIQLNFASAIVVSVVPELDTLISEICARLFKITPVFVDHTTELGLKIEYDPPSSLGADRLVNAFAARSLYGTPVVVCSFGTATTIDVVDAAGAFIGGLIAPGMGTMAASLNQNTARLPAIRIQKPKRTVQDTTEGAILSGVYFGQVELARGLIKRVTSDLSSVDGDPDPKVVATGGFAELISADVDSFDVLDSDLTLKGLRMVAERIGHPL